MPQCLTSAVQTASSVASSASRFKIVPVESRYQRGRWACVDYYEENTRCVCKQKVDQPNDKDRFVATDALFVPLKQFSSSSENNLAVSDAVSTIVNTSSVLPLTAPTSSVNPVNFGFVEDFGAANPTLGNQFSNSFQSQISSNSGCHSTYSMTPSVDSTANTKSSASSHVTPNPELVNTGYITPSEILNYGLERSLSTTSHSDKSILDLLPGAKAQNATRNISRIRVDKSAITSGSTNNPSLVAIDSKIEQAMDLVKTHLMFAVREEVEMLRAKIIELEATVLQLDAENAILREHIPPEALNKIGLKLSQQNSATATV